VEGGALRRSASARNLSANGVGLSVGHRLEPGTVLILQLPAEGAGPGRTTLARVVRVCRQEDGSWFVGCRFARELTDEELTAALRAGDRLEGPLAAAVDWPAGGD
jgi:hypothetical protein